MPTYELEQYELHVTKYRVEATDEGEAVAKLFAGEADPMDNSTEYIEVAEDYGMPVDQNRELADKLREAGNRRGRRHHSLAPVDRRGHVADPQRETWKTTKRPKSTTLPQVRSRT